MAYGACIYLINDVVSTNVDAFRCYLFAETSLISLFFCASIVEPTYSLVLLGFLGQELSI